MTQHTNSRKYRHICVLSFLLSLIVGLYVSCERENSISGDIHDSTGNIGDEELVGDGLFSVSEVTKVRFAPGNLKPGGHGFTANQYDYGGLFGWGTGDSPNITSTDNQDYAVFHDWGMYNLGGLWRTLAKEEWEYLFFQRIEANKKMGMATISGVTGLILLPDKWVPVPDCEFKPGFGWRQNVYDSVQWSKMENAGAVFLPAAGYRWGTDIFFAKTGGYYWVAPSTVGPYAHLDCVDCFDENRVSLEVEARALGCSVRLVEEKNN